MFVVVTKWKIIVLFEDLPPVVLWLYDDHLGNILRKVSEMQFTEDGRIEPLSITIAKVP